MIFSDQKVAQIAAFFLGQAQGAMPHLKLIKLMYLADRESMARFDVPMTDDRPVSMPHGPVLSSTLNLIKGTSRSDAWSHWISPLENHEVRLACEIETLDDLDELSKADLSVMESVWQQFGHMSKYQLRDYTHKHLPEWHDPNGSSKDIDIRETFQALGQDAELAKRKVKYLQERKALGRVLAEFT